VVEQIRETIDHLARLALVARGLADCPRPSEVVDIVVRQGMGGLGAEGGVLALVAADGAVVPVETVGYTQAAVAAFAPMHVGQELPLTVAVRAQEPVWVSSREDAASRFPGLLDAGVSGSQAWAAVPLIAHGSVLGVLGVSFLAPHDFTESERLFIGALGDQCTLALAADRAQGASHSPEMDEAAPSAHPRRRATRGVEFPIGTLVVRREQDAASEIAHALRDDSHFAVNECDDHAVLAELMQEEPLDLVVVLSDLQAASRIQIVHMVRARWPEATLVLLTGDSAVEEQAWRVGADAVFGMAMPAGLLRSALVALMDEAGLSEVPELTRRSRARRGASIDAHTLSTAMFARSLDAVMFTAPDGRILAANPAACRILGLSEPEIRQRGRSGIADPTDTRWASGLREREATGRVFGELSMLKGDGTSFAAEVSSAVFENEFGEARTVVVFRDVADRKQLAHELQPTPTDEEARAQIAQTLLEVAIRRLWAVGTALTAGIQGPSDLLIARAQAAIDELDETIRELRNTLLPGS
jgi:PAS domain S-box-containing protein